MNKHFIISLLFLILITIGFVNAETIDENNSYHDIQNAELNTLEIEEINNNIENNTYKEDNNSLINQHKLSQESIIEFYVDKNANNSIEDGSKLFPFKTLNEDNLEKITSNSIIHVSRGIYDLNTIKINKNISIIGNVDVIFTSKQSTSAIIVEKNATVFFENITFKNFTSDTSAAITNNGNLMIINGELINNVGTTTNNRGGAILNNGFLEIINTTFQNNTASYGAAIYSSGNLIIKDSNFINNNIYNVGGAIYSVRGNLTVYNSYFTKNRAVSGAAIYNAAGYMYVNNTEFIDNDAEHFFGGAIYSTGITITHNSIFWGNHAKKDGGAITTTSNFTVINCSFNDNSADENGGAIENVPWSITENGNLTILNSTFVGNSAGENGGVIINYGKEESVGEIATVTVRNSVFDSNNAFKGGVIYNQQYIDFEGNIFVNNVADEYNVIYTTSDLIKSVENNWWGKNNVTFDDIGVVPEKWIIMSFTNTTPLQANYNVSVVVSLNTLNTLEKYDSRLPKRTVVFYGDNVIFEKYELTFNNVTYNTLNYKNGIIYAKIDNQILSLEHIVDINNTIIIINPIKNVKYADNVTISGIFKDIDGKLLRNSHLKVSLNGKNINVKTDSNAIFSTSLKTSVIGENNVTVSYSGNNKYSYNIVSTTFNVIKQDVLITFDNIESVNYNDNVLISGTFKDVNGRLLVNSNLRLTLNNKKYNIKTDVNGKFLISIKTTVIGENTVALGYSGNNRYNEYNTTSTFDVYKQDVIVSIDDFKVNNNNVMISGKFTDIKGKSLVNSNVIIIINGVTYNSKTNLEGNYLFDKTVDLDFVITYTVGYSGSARYNQYKSSSVTTIIY